MIIFCGIILVGAVTAATRGLLLNLHDRALAENECALESLALTLAGEVDCSFAVNRAYLDGGN